MKDPKFLVQRTVTLWNSISSNDKKSPKEIAIEIARIIGHNPIPIILLAQQSSDETIRLQAIQAYYYLMEEEMVRKSIELSIV
ncbi:MAG: hypothetical protein EU530_05390 [Promethearchaeota archaeon]|nr:MAG: hypothetical protein EU530_05390 [Candidatus Lokiarchaeota archaeon]